MLTKNAVFALLISGLALLSACNPDETPEPDSDTSTIIEETEVKDGNGNVIETIVTFTDRGEGIGTRTLTNNKTWILKGLVFVNDGQILTIEPGTVIKGKSGQGENASALVVARGGKIMANGTAADPIIFTAEADDLNGNLPPTARGLWGGLIVLGKASLNSAPGETAIEGIPTSESRGIYGGNDDTDNSGIIKYVSIRHGGTDIGAGNEINGLTLGGVGSGTTVDYVEIIANNDDGVEFFGGTVNTSHIISAYCRDDAVDYDEGWRGKNQFIFVFQDPDNGDRGGEHDGGTDPEDGLEYATPWFYNATYIGRGEAAQTRALTFRDNAGGEYHNSIFVGFGKGIDVEDLNSGEDSKARLDAGDLKIMDNIFWNVIGNDMSKLIITSGDVADVDLWGTTNVSGNSNEDPQLTGASPDAAGPAGNATGLAGDTFIQNVSYKGAFEPGQSPWYMGWTLLDEAGLVQ